mmetsp:Transcript_93156/g.266163  ORF Transcript_93156/g.266163 Transcript_93156/m.266163 type:complete len:248 (-) Transcript_93156:203-946(-)
MQQRLHERTIQDVDARHIALLVIVEPFDVGAQVANVGLFFKVRLASIAVDLRPHQRLHFRHLALVLVRRRGRRFGLFVAIRRRGRWWPRRRSRRWARRRPWWSAGWWYAGQTAGSPWTCGGTWEVGRREAIAWRGGGRRRRGRRHGRRHGPRHRRWRDRRARRRSSRGRRASSPPSRLGGFSRHSSPSSALVSLFIASLTSLGPSCPSGRSQRRLCTPRGHVANDAGTLTREPVGGGRLQTAWWVGR